MPIYEYQCNRCACKFEQRQSFNENTPVPCPECGSSTQRLFSRVPIIFKGPGFYVTDSRKNHEKPSSDGDTDKAKVPESAAPTLKKGDKEDPARAGKA